MSADRIVTHVDAQGWYWTYLDGSRYIAATGGRRYRRRADAADSALRILGLEKDRMRGAAGDAISRIMEYLRDHPDHHDGSYDKLLAELVIMELGQTQVVNGLEVLRFHSYVTNRARHVDLEVR